MIDTTFFSSAKFKIVHAAAALRIHTVRKIGKNVFFQTHVCLHKEIVSISRARDHVNGNSNFVNNHHFEGLIIQSCSETLHKASWFEQTRVGMIIRI